MKVAIDVTPMVSAHSLRGVGAYAKNLIGALQKYENGYSYHFFVRGENVPEDADLVHYPYFDPFFLTLPIIKTKPTVVTVHDLTPLVFLRHFRPGLLGKLKWYIQRLSLLGVTRIIADSENSKRDVVKLMGFSSGRIDVVYLAPAATLAPVTDSLLLKNVQQKYQLPPQFILYVGDVNWNKNVPGLIYAVQKLQLNLKFKMKLVLAGKAFLESALPEARDINQLAEKLGITKDILKLGFVPDEELATIYSLATVYIQPSFYEGFGLPVLEAMACGCPVVVARGSSLDEIVGPALRVETTPEAIKEGLVIALSLSPNERDELIKKQFTWVKRFSWRKTAQKVVGCYAKAVART